MVRGVTRWNTGGVIVDHKLVMAGTFERHAWPQMVAGGGEAGEREGRPDRRNQLDLSVDMM